MVNALPLRYPGRHTWSIMKIIQQNKPQEMETPLNNVRKIAISVINFYTINYLIDCVLLVGFYFVKSILSNAAFWLKTG